MATTTAATATEIQTLYVAYFNRPADPLGLQVLLNSGASLQTLANGFSASDEYKTTYAGKTTLDLVDSIYMNLFGRHAESAGLLFWAARLQSGTDTFASIVLTIASNAQDDGTNNDLTAINSKVAAATAFTESLDTAADIRGYDGAAANASVKLWLAGVKDAATLATATTAAALQAASDAATAAHDGTINNPQSLVLTTGVDTIVGGAGNDTITASNTPAASGTSTFTGLDSIDGGAGKDTLNINDTDGAAGTLDLSIATVKNVEIANIVSTGSLKGNAADVSGWTGLTNANFTLKSAAVQTITAAGTTAVTASNTAGVTVVGGSSINVTAGNSIAALTTLANAITTASADADITAALSAAQTAGAITAGQATTISTAYGFGGGAANPTAAEIAAGKAAIATVLGTTASLAVTATTNSTLASASVKGGSTVTIIDGSSALDQLKSVSLDSNVGAASLTGKALTSVSVANTSQNVTINNATASHTEAVTLTNVKGGTIQDAAATTLNITTATTKSSGVTFSAAAATKVNVAAAVDLSATLTTGAATSVVVTGAGKVTIAGATLDAAAVIDGSANTGGVIVTPVLGNTQNFIGGAGKDTVSVAQTTKVINLGAGDDTVIVTDHLATGGKVDGGAGTDTIAGTAAVLSVLNAADAAALVNFETYKVTDALTAATFDVSQIAGVVNFVAGAGVTAGATAVATGLGANANVSILGAATTGILNLVQKTDTTADVINLTLNHSFTVNDDSTATNTPTATTVGAQLVETVNVVSTGTPSIANSDLSVGSKADTITNVLTLNDDALVTLKVSGDQAFSITTAASQTKLATIDASANTAGATIDAHLNTIALTIKGTAKADTITGGTQGDTLTGGGGIDTFKFVAGSSSIGTGKFDTITDFVANTYGNAVDASSNPTGGAGTGAGVDATKWTGDILSFAHAGTGATAFKVDVLTSAADATTYLANNKDANGVVAALDSSNNNLYVDNTGDGVADFYIHLTGVTTINAAAFVIV